MEDKRFGKYLLVIGTLAFLITIAYSLIFYKERMAFTDAAYHLFHIIANNRYEIQSSRFVAFFTQSFVLFPARAGCSLESIAQLYSFSFPFLNLLAFWVLMLGFRNYRLSLVFLLLSFLMTRASFYWCLSDIVQGYVFFFIYLACLLRHPDKQQHFGLKLLQYVCLFFTVFSHPLMLFSVLFALVFLAYTEEDSRRRIAKQAVIFLLLYAVKHFFFKSPNDESASGGIRDGLHDWRNFMHWAVNRNFVVYLVKDYQLVAMLWIVSLFYYQRNKQWFLFKLLGVSFVGYVLLNNIATRQGAGQFYIESHYLALCLFVALPMVWHLFPRISSVQFKASGLVILLSVSLWGIYRHHLPYTARVGLLRSKIALMKSEGSDKWIIRPKELPREQMVIYWAVSFEVWLLSTIEEQRSYSLLVREKVNEFYHLEHCNTCFGTKWVDFQYEKLPPRYFILKHTDYPYTVH